MPDRASPSGIALSHRDTRMARGMLIRGDRQHDIASYFGVNGGRIGEVATHQDRYPNAEPLPPEELPPPGPYLTKFAVQRVIQTLQEARDMIDIAITEKQMENTKAALELAKESLQDKICSLEDA